MVGMAMLEASREETVDVAVVGGGPGGLATAAAIISAFGDNASVKVRRLSDSPTDESRRQSRFEQCLAAVHCCSDCLSVIW